jgi:hypothetical protein
MDLAKRRGDIQLPAEFQLWSDRCTLSVTKVQFNGSICGVSDEVNRGAIGENFSPSENRRTCISRAVNF